jgi:hypothetical protein
MDSIDKYHLLLLYITYFIYHLMGFCPMKKNLLRVKSLPWWLKPSDRPSWAREDVEYFKAAIVAWYRRK